MINIFQGESLSVTLCFDDENGSPITALPNTTIDAYVHSYANSKGFRVPFEDMTVNGGIVTFRLNEAQTSQLLGATTIEVRVNDGEDIMIDSARIIFVEKTQISKSTQNG